MGGMFKSNPVVFKHYNSLDEAFHPQRKGARVIAVASGKGGVGKTSLAVNLSLALSKLGQRVIIMDADLGLANVEVLLGVTPLFTLFDFLYRGKDVEDILTPGPGGVFIISGGSGFLELAGLNNQQQRKIIDSLAAFDERADFVIIDTGAGISRNVLSFVAAAGEVIIIVTPEPTSLTDAYSLIKILAMFQVHSEVLLVVNRAADERDAASVTHRMETVVSRFLEIGMVHLGSIYEDRAVIRSVRSQQPFVIFQPDSIPALIVSTMAHYLVTGSRSTVGYGNSGIKQFILKMVRLFR